MLSPYFILSVCIMSYGNSYNIARLMVHCRSVFVVSVSATSRAGHILRRPSPPLDNIRVMVIVWRLRGNIIRTALCWIVWHNVHSLQHTYVSSSYRSNRLGLSHQDPYTMRRGGCLELYYCNMVECFWWDSSMMFDDQLVSFSALTLLVWSSSLQKIVPQNDLRVGH